MQGHLIKSFQRSVTERGTIQIENSNYRAVLTKQAAEIYGASLIVQDEPIQLGFLQMSGDGYQIVGSDYTQICRAPNAKSGLKKLIQHCIRPSDDEETYELRIDTSGIPNEIVSQMRDRVRQVETGEKHPMGLGGTKIRWRENMYSIPVTGSWRVMLQKTDQGFVAKQALSHEDYNKIQKKYQRA